ncbi:hypothetical protein ACLB2K_061579 [Fragaria x ananassa]
MPTAVKTLLTTIPTTNLGTYVQKCISFLKTHNSITEGTVLHGHLVKTGLSSKRYIAVRLLIMYLDTRKPKEAAQVLKEFKGFDPIVHNCLINDHVKRGNVDEARRLFDLMPKRNDVAWTALISGLMKCGRVREAMWYFERNPFRNVISWTAAISGLVQNGRSFEMFKLFRNMFESGVRPNYVTFSSVLSGCVEFGFGMSVLGMVVKVGFEKNVSVLNSLVSLCVRMGEMVRADNVSWNTMVGGYLENKEFDKVFEVFNEMLLCGVTPNISTFSSVLNCCASIASLEKGKNLHGKAIKHGIQFDVFVGTTLTDMYAKSGDIDSSKKVFDRMPKKNEISWTVMIQGLADNGFAEECLSLFEEMRRTSTVAPNELMLLSVLFACSHTGLIDKGLQYFNSMLSVYGIRPRGRHCTSVVDMLSRSGCLSEAEDFIKSMPFEPETSAWAALLSGCNRYKNDEIAERTARKLLELVERNFAGYVMLSNIYALAGRWIDVRKIRRLMRDRGLKKSAVGCSWVEVKNVVHCFYAEDASHCQLAEISDLLELLRLEMQIPNANKQKH